MSDEIVTWVTTRGDTVEVYRRHALKRPVEQMVMGWGYRVRATNNKIVEQGSEGYSRRRAAVRAAERHHPRVSVERVEWAAAEPGFETDPDVGWTVDREAAQREVEVDQAAGLDSILIVRTVTTSEWRLVQ